MNKCCGKEAQFVYRFLATCPRLAGLGGAVFGVVGVEKARKSLLNDLLHGCNIFKKKNNFPAAGNVFSSLLLPRLPCGCLTIC